MAEYLLSNKRTFRAAAGSGLVLLLLVAVGSWSVLKRIDTRLRSDAGDSLNETLASRHAAYKIWKEQREKLVSVQSQEPQVRVFAERLLKVPRTPDALLKSEVEAETRKYFAPVLEGAELTGFFIIAPDLLNLASKHDGNVGTRSLIAEQRPELLRGAFEGNERFVFDLRSDVPLDTAAGPAPEGAPTAFVIAPIQDMTGRVLAVLAFGVDMSIFNTVARLGRIGDTGETFAFAKDGTILTESRFSFKKWPLTAGTPLTGGSSGIDTVGYRDYRGAEVFGSWVWDDGLGFGVATEVEAGEAMESYRNIRSLGVALTSGIVLLAGALYVVVYRSRQRAIAILELAKAQLERQVDERTRSISIFAHAVRTAAECMSITDMNDVTLFVNDSFVQTYGYSSEELIGKPITIVRPPNEPRPLMPNILEATLAGGWKGELVNRRRDGTDFPISLSTSVIRNQSGEPIALIGIAMDITEQKKAERELIEAREAAVTAALAKSQFLATMSHEIRTPMNGVIGMTQLLSTTDLSAEQRDYVETIRSSGDSLLEIINEILDFSRIESGRIELENRPFSLDTAVRDLMNLMKPRAREKGLRLVQTIDPAVPRVLIGDVTRLKQVFINLIGNALKFTSEGAVDIRVRVLEQNESRAELHCSVNDTGIGIPQSRFDRLFKAFSQVDSSTNRRFGGTGLGLAISARLSELMGGRIWVDSTAGKGSTFHFTLIAGIGKEADIRVRAGTGVLQPQGKLNIQILVAEDNATNQKLILSILNRMGYLADLAANGVDAVRAARESPYDLIFMDVQMPVMDGLEATELLRREGARTGSQPYIVAMTADALPGDREKCLAAGMDGYISKPIALEEIQSVIERVAATSGNFSAFQHSIDKFKEIGGDSFAADMIETYLTDAGAELQRLRQAASEQDANELRAAAHALKGCSGMVGAQTIVVLCREMERAASADSFLEIPGMMRKLSAECGTVGVTLQNILKTQLRRTI